MFLEFIQIQASRKSLFINERFTPREMLQPYFTYKKTHIVFCIYFSFRATLGFYLMIPVVNFDIDQKSIHLVKILKLHETKNEKDFIDFHNILEIEQFWRVSLEHFKFSVDLLFLKSGKMDRKIDINGKPAEEEWRSQVRRKSESGTTTTTSLWLQYAACSWLLYVLLQCFFL